MIRRRWICCAEQNRGGEGERRGSFGDGGERGVKVHWGFWNDDLLGVTALGRVSCYIGWLYLDMYLIYRFDLRCLTVIT